MKATPISPTCIRRTKPALSMFEIQQAVSLQLAQGAFDVPSMGIDVGIGIAWISASN